MILLVTRQDLIEKYAKEPLDEVDGTHLIGNHVTAAWAIFVKSDLVIFIDGVQFKILKCRFPTPGLWGEYEISDMASPNFVKYFELAQVAHKHLTDF